MLADARERFCADGEKRTEFHARNGPNAPSNRTRPPPVDGMAAGVDTFRTTIGREAFRGMFIWEIPGMPSDGERSLL